MTLHTQDKTLTTHATHINSLIHTLHCFCITTYYWICFQIFCNEFTINKNTDFMKAGKLKHVVNAKTQKQSLFLEAAIYSWMSLSVSWNPLVKVFLLHLVSVNRKRKISRRSQSKFHKAFVERNVSVSLSAFFFFFVLYHSLWNSTIWSLMNPLTCSEQCNRNTSKWT